MLKKAKSKNRLEIIETICDGITHQEIFETIDYKKQSEDKIKQFTYPILVNTLTEFLAKNPRWGNRTRAREFVKERLLWEGNIKTTVHHTHFMGTKNRPDMIFEIDALKIACITNPMYLLICHLLILFLFHKKVHCQIHLNPLSYNLK